MSEGLGAERRKAEVGRRLGGAAAQPEGNAAPPRPAYRLTFRHREERSDAAICLLVILMGLKRISCRLPYSLSALTV